MKKHLFILLALLSLASCGSVSKLSVELQDSEEPQSDVGEKTIENSLKNDTLVDDYSSDLNAVINYAVHKQASYTYSLSMMTAVCKSKTVGISVDQNIQSANLYTPDVNFNQNISSSSFVKTADRFYDYNKGTIDGYCTKKSSDWKNMTEPTVYTYDNYIQNYGKLIKSEYYCVKSTDEELTLPEKYDTDKKDEANENSYVVNAICMYRFASSTIKNGTLKKDGSNYTLYLNLEPDKATAYSKVQMKNTGGLADYPEFESCEMTFSLDSELNLISASETAKYHAKVSVLSTDIEMSSEYVYLHSEDENFTRNGKTVKVTVPTMSEESFKGYELLD